MNRRRPRSDFDGFGATMLVALVAFGVLVFSTWAACEAPCTWYRGVRLADTPGRCVMGSP